MLAYFKKFDYRLWILAGGWVASSVGFSLAIPFVSLYFHSDLGISLTGIGVFFGISAIVRSIFQAIGGELSDRVGRYPLMVFSQLARSVTFWLIALSISHGWGFYNIAGLIILNSIFGALFQPAANATVADLVSKEQRTEGYSIVRVGGNLGWAIGPAVGGFIAAKSYAMLFVFSGAMTLISGLVFALFLRGIKRAEYNEEKFSFKEIFVWKGNELILKHATLVFVLYLVASQFIAPFSLYSVDFMGISKEQLGFLFTLNGLMVTFLQIPVTKALGRMKLTIQLAIGALIYAVGYQWIGFNSTFVAFIIGIATITIGENFVSPPALAISANLAPKGRIGRYMGIYGFAVTAGWSLGPSFGGMLLDWARPSFLYAWSIIAIMALIPSIGFMGMTRRIPAELNLRKSPNK